MSAIFPASSSSSSNNSRSADRSCNGGSLFNSVLESLWSTISSLVVMVDGGGGGGGGNGNGIGTSSSSSSSSDVLVNLPYIGPTPLPFVLFVGSAIMFRVSQFWRQHSSTRPKSSSSSSPKTSNPRSSGCRGGGDGSYASPSYTNNNDTRKSVTVVVADSKAKTYKVSAYTNQNQQALNEFMEKARSCKQKLRHVDDPERVRQAKICIIRKQQRQHCATAANDPLQLSETKLLDKLASLKKTIKTKNAVTGKDTQNMVVQKNKL